MDIDESHRLSPTAAEQRVQAAYGSVPRAQRFYQTQMLDRLNSEMHAFIDRQEMMFVATADAEGRCDSTFRAGPAGFVSVLNDEQLAWPEYRGNGVHASLANIADNGHAGLLFMDFFQDIIGLHVNGTASIADDTDVRSQYPHVSIDVAPGRRAEQWIIVDIDEAYVHCRKHIPRLTKRENRRDWGTDDVRSKGGDFFHVRRQATAAPGIVAGRPELEVPSMASVRRQTVGRRMHSALLRAYPSRARRFGNAHEVDPT